jgi:hypothetical protein
MCEACHDDHEEENADALFESLPESKKQEFYDYITSQMNLVMEKAENHGVLFELITEWSKEKQIAYEMATVIEDRVLNDKGEDDDISFS